MNISSFRKDILPGCRTKHIEQTDRRLDFRQRVSRLLGRSPLVRPGRVSYRLGVGKVPAEFIRQDPWESEYLFCVAQAAKKGILEIGRFNGGSAVVFASANADIPIESIDVAPKDDAYLRRLLAEIGIGDNIQLHVGDSRGPFPNIGEFDLLFIDGDHSYEGCLADLENWYPRLMPGGHVLMHDCYYGCEVQAAILHFLSDRKVETFTTPYKLSDHARYPEGSIFHFRKPLL